MRIAIFTDSQTVNSNYRSYPLAALAKRGHEIRLDVDGGDARIDVLRRFDVVHVYRYHERKMREIAEELRAAGVGLVWDNDDDLTTGPDHGRFKIKKDGLRSQQTRSDMIRMLQLAHVVTTSSHVLAREYARWGAERVRVVENFIPPTFEVPAREPRGDRLVIGWTAGGEHIYDAKALRLDDVFRELLEAHPDVDVMSVGVRLNLPPERYTNVRFTQFYELSKHVAAFDIGIAPIADHPFNQARSNVKIKEYAYLGIPWLASPIGPYAGHGEKQGGRLVEDGGWFDALDRLVRDERARKKLAKQAAKWGKRQTALANLEQWEAPLLEAAKLARGA